MNDCVRLNVPGDCCYVTIEGGGPVRCSEATDYLTPGGARLVLDFDVQGRVVGIELLGHQRCMSDIS